MSIVYLAGLPRSGSTLLCNILNQHPKISASPSSPLCNTVQHMKRTWSDDPFLLSQLDSNLDTVYDKLHRATRAFMETWCYDENTEISIDKNRGWLSCLNLLKHLYPDFKMIITLRDLRSIFASIEKQHRKTMLLDFPDHMDSNNIDNRANTLFGDTGVIGSVLKGLNNISDIPDISQHLYFWKYESFLSSPIVSITDLFNWIGVDHQIDLDFDNIEQSTIEADSYYRFKYLHTIDKKIQAPPSFNEVKISPRILNSITTKYAWYYNTYYKEIAETPKKQYDETNNEIESALQKDE